MVLNTATTALQANLTCLGPLNSDLGRLLEECEVTSEIEFSPTEEGVLGAVYQGRSLCSRHRPLSEAQRLIESIDLVENAVFVVNGFGLGYHVKALAQRLKKQGIIVVFEPDIELLRAVFERINHADWMAASNIIWVTDPQDAGVLGRKLNQSEAILALGIAFIDHPASRARLSESALKFSVLFRDHMISAKTTLMTSLVRSMDTVRNYLLNIDHYTAGPGVAELAGITPGYPAVIVSAGPSLQKNIHQLAGAGIRDRCVIIATQTTIKPLLAAGVKPHFVTSLDYHEISKRFYEDLDPKALQGVTLIADPKANPVILDAFPGPVRCCESNFLDRMLGDLKRDMGALPAGSTVAHLAVYVARHMGCNPIVMIGQDLGFPDGLYYTPGTAIHEVWAPELNPFNTIEMMEWQRIVRHRLHLQKTLDIKGRSIYTDAQMLTYLKQFERDFHAFGEEGIDIIDATEGGVAKKHVRLLPLRETLEKYATRPLPDLPPTSRELQTERLGATSKRVSEMRREIAQLREIALKTSPLIGKMLTDQDDVAKMARHFKKIDTYKTQVDQRNEAFELISILNQLGLFKRMKADRRLNVQTDLTPLERQRAELVRDQENVNWIAEAAQEMVNMLLKAERVLAGKPVELREKIQPALDHDDPEARDQLPNCIAALIPVDPQQSGRGMIRDLGASLNNRSVLQCTLERLGRSKTIESIILIVPEGHDVEPLIDRARIDRPVEIETCAGSPFGAEQRAVAAARAWADTCWRGGIGGMSVYDEVICPRVMDEIMEKRGLTAALLVGPDWTHVNVTGEGGCDEVVRRHLEFPRRMQIVITQSPPGLCGCVINRELMKQLTERNRLSTIGSLLVYQPHTPQHDPIARDVNVQIDHRIRRPLLRAIADTPRDLAHLDQAAQEFEGSGSSDTIDLIRKLEQLENDQPPSLPRHVIMEACTERSSHGLYRRSLWGNGRYDPVQRPPLEPELAETIFRQLAKSGDTTLTFGGLGDPLLHPNFDRLIVLAREAGIRFIQVRTELNAGPDVIKRLLDSDVDVVSVDLHADRAATYETMMGHDQFKAVLVNLQFLITQRRPLTDHDGAVAIALPWIVPRLQRRVETFEDIESFYDRWQHLLGVAVIEPAPKFSASEGFPVDTLTQTRAPARVNWHQLNRRMTIYSDGSVPVSELDVTAQKIAGHAGSDTIENLWTQLLGQRAALKSQSGEECESLRMLLP